MKTQDLELSHNLLKVVCLGTYNTIFEADFDQVEYSMKEDGKSDDEIAKHLNTFDFGKYKKEIIENANQTICEIIAAYNDELENQGHSKLKMTLIEESLKLWSPREYNFMTDTLEYDVTVADDIADYMINLVKNDDKFEPWLAEFNGSYDGYASREPTTIADFIYQINSSNLNSAYGAVISYLIKDLFDDDEKRDFQMDILERLNGNGAVDNCFDYE